MHEHDKVTPLFPSQPRQPTTRDQTASSRWVWMRTTTNQRERERPIHADRNPIQGLPRPGALKNTAVPPLLPPNSDDENSNSSPVHHAFVAAATPRWPGRR
ncbi:unnamed protein product, partial [Ectocarpus sp. 12 AP-2014]